MNSSLFPEYAILENGRNEAQAMRLAEQLREVDLQSLVTDSDRRMVVARLRREGVDNAMQLILLTQEEVMGWYNVGPVFLAILTEIHDEVMSDPERVVSEWKNRHRLFVLPDDLEETHRKEDDFFGMLIAEDDECYRQHTESEHPVLLLERSLVAAVEMYGKRSEHGVVLRKFFIDGLSADAIAASCHLASAASVFRIVDHKFVRPLLKGYQICGIQFGDSLLSLISSLRKQLLYCRVVELDMLSRVPASRFLYLLGLTLLKRTQAENFWGGDYIVKEGEVEKCRRTMRDVFSCLQFRVVWAKENVIRRNVKGANVPFLRELLKSHPYVETDRKGYRLVGEHLAYDCSRLARLVYDARSAVALPDLLSAYERLYMERPLSVSISHVRTRFPQVHSVKRGVWEWK